MVMKRASAMGTILLIAFNSTGDLFLTENIVFILTKDLKMSQTNGYIFLDRI